MNKIKSIIRAICVIFAFGFFGIGALIVYYFVFPLNKLFLKKGENIKIKQIEVIHKVWRFFVKILSFLKIINIEAYDIEKIRNIKNSIIVSTHPSYIDILILISIIPNSTCFVAERLQKNIFFRGIVKSLFISEGQTLEGWSSEAQKRLDEGFNIIIFPMGIRHKKDERPKIKRGAAYLAQKTHKNIEMINMTTNYNFLGINQPIYKVEADVVVYSLEYRGRINTEEFLKKFPDSVTFKTELTKYITKTLY